jgi:dTDP-glucose pyrophosphorylase
VKTKKQTWRRAILPVTATIEQAIRNLEQVSIRIVLVTNEAGVLQGTVSDGDIRRGLLKGLDLSAPITGVLHRDALVVTPDIGINVVMELMVTNKLQQIPVVDERRKVVDLYLWDELAVVPPRPNLFVIMAGGKGTRMLPHTENCPKPLLPVAGKPMLEHIIERAKLDGFRHFVIATHFLGHLIEAYFENGERLGVRIDYLRELAPLGTAGALSLIDPLPSAPFVVTNGDVLSDVRYGEMLDFHIRNTSIATMAIRLHEWQNPFGVVQTQGIEITEFEEKPVTRSNINAGIYALSPSALRVLSSNPQCDMPALFRRLREKNHRTIVYPLHEPWQDVGNPVDLQIANARAAGLFQGGVND